MVNIYLSEFLSKVAANLHTPLTLPNPIQTLKTINMENEATNPAYYQTALNGWIKLNGIAGEMEDCDCWVLRDDGEIFLSPKGEFIAIGDYEYYQPIIKPKELPNDFKVTT